MNFSEVSGLNFSTFENLDEDLCYKYLKQWFRNIYTPKLLRSSCIVQILEAACVHNLYPVFLYTIESIGKKRGYAHMCGSCKARVDCKDLYSLTTWKTGLPKLYEICKDTSYLFLVDIWYMIFSP